MNAKNKIGSNILLVIFCIALTIIQLIILNKDSTSGENLTKMKAEIGNYDEENILLSQKIASSSSIVSISSKAKNLGFNDTNNSLSLNGPIPIAFSNR